MGVNFCWTFFSDKWIFCIHAHNERFKFHGEITWFSYLWRCVMKGTHSPQLCMISTPVKSDHLCWGEGSCRTSVTSWVLCFWWSQTGIYQFNPKFPCFWVLNIYLCKGENTSSCKLLIFFQKGYQGGLFPLPWHV